MKIEFLNKYINAKEFAEIVNTHFVESLNSGIKAIQFDLSRVKWINFFETCLLLLWIYYLRSKTKTKCIEIVLPRSQEVQNFLFNWGFLKQISTLKVELKKSRGRISNDSYGSKNEIKRSIDFFQSSNDFDSFYRIIKSDLAQETIYGDLSYLKVIKKGDLRNVIIKEIGENIYDHADGKAPLFSMIEFLPLDAKKIYSRINNSLDAERNFFSNLGINGFLEIVICDLGGGIYQTLLETFVKDETIPHEIRNMKIPQDVIDYSFQKYSSCKTS